MFRCGAASLKILDELIDQAADDTAVSLPNVLRKCLIVAHLLKNDKLKFWVEKELNGYHEDDADVPSYREIRAPAKGLVIGPSGQYNNQPIPASSLKERHRHFALTVTLRQPVGSYSTIDTGKTVVIEWPADLTAMYHNVFRAHNLNRAWQEIPTSAISGLVENVRNRILQLALQLRDEVEATQQDSLAAIPSPVVERIVVNNIYGGTNIIGSQAGQMSQSGNASHVTAGNWDDLEKALRDKGLSAEDTAELKASIEQDQKADPDNRIGEKTLSWIKSKSAKLAGRITEVALTKLLVDFLLGK